MIRHVIDSHTVSIPAVLEIPSKDQPYDPNKDSILRRAKVGKTPHAVLVITVTNMSWGLNMVVAPIPCNRTRHGIQGVTILFGPAVFRLGWPNTHEGSPVYVRLLKKGLEWTATFSIVAMWQSIS